MERKINLLEQIFEQSLDGICIVDLNKKIIKVNTTFTKFFGVDKDAVVGESIGEKYGITEEYCRKIKDICKGKDDCNMPIIFTTVKFENGEEKVVNISPSPLYDIEGQLEKFCFNYREVTDLYNSRQRLQFQDILMRNINDAVFAIDLDRNISYWNKAVENIFELSSDEIVDNKIDSSQIFKFIELLLSDSSNSKRSVVIEYSFEKDNYENHKHIESSISTVRNESNEIIGYVVICRDITEKITQEMQMINSELEKSTILDNQTDLIILQDLESNIVWANKSALISADCDLNSIKEKKCYEIWGETGGVCENCSVYKVKHTEVPEEFERITSSGKIWKIKASPIFDKNGKLHRILEVAEDITEKKQVERRIAENEAQYRNLVNSAPVGIIVFQQTLPIFANSKAVEIMGFDSLNEFLTTDIFMYLHPDDVDYMVKTINNIKKDNFKDKSFNVNFRIITKDNNTRYLTLTSTNFLIEGEEYYQSILIDNTEIAELNAVQKNLAVESIYLNEKNKLIEELSKKFSYLSEKYNFENEDKRKYEKILRTYFQPERDWMVSKKHFEAVHKDFFTKLKMTYPNMTQNELRHCAYMRMNYTTKEIARIFNVEAASIQKARLRLKKKMNLDRNEDLYMFIMSI